MPTLYFSALLRDYVIAVILFFLVIVSAIQARNKQPIDDSPWPPRVERYWNLFGFSAMMLGFLRRIVFRDQ